MFVYHIPHNNHPNFSEVELMNHFTKNNTHKKTPSNYIRET